MNVMYKHVLLHFIWANITSYVLCLIEIRNTRCYGVQNYNYEGCGNLNEDYRACTKLLFTSTRVIIIIIVKWKTTKEIDK